MRKLYLAILFLGTYFNCVSQSIQWQKVFGGSEDDVGSSIIEQSSNNLLVCGATKSDDGDIFFHYSGNSWDVLLVSLDSVGNIYWNNCYGGSTTDQGKKIISTKDNRILVQAISTSTNGDITGMHDHGPDIWLAKLYAQDSIEWGNCFGSFDIENALDVTQTLDSGFVIIGETDGDDGDVSGNHAIGNNDIWVFKIDKNGILQWQVCLGSWSLDVAGAITVTPDNGLLIVGSAITGQGGSVQCNSSIMGENVWLVKLDSIGNVLWDRCYGSSGTDEGKDVVASPNGGYYVLGYASINDGDVTGLNGQADYWLLRVDDSGNLLWQKCYGGSGIDLPYSIALAPNGDVLMCGLTNSVNGHATSNHGSNDAFIVRTDSSGNLLWSQCYGGSGSDIGYSIVISSDGFPVFTGMTESNDGDVSGNHGGKDLWLVKLNESPVSISEVNSHVSDFKYTFFEGQLTLSFISKRDEKAEIKIFDLLGRDVLSQSINCKKGFNQFTFAVKNVHGLNIIGFHNIMANTSFKIILD